MKLTERWTLAKGSVVTEIGRLNVAAAKFAAEFKDRTGQEIFYGGHSSHCGYTPLIPEERSGGWQAASKGRPQIAGATIVVIGDNGNSFQPKTGEHWPFGISVAERLARDLVGISDEMLEAHLASSSSFTGE